jgi:hypothetical protein
MPIKQWGTINFNKLWFLAKTFKFIFKVIYIYLKNSKGFNPSKNDVETYGKVLDRNEDGKVTL